MILLMVVVVVAIAFVVAVVVVAAGVAAAVAAAAVAAVVAVVVAVVASVCNKNTFVVVCLPLMVALLFLLLLHTVGAVFVQAPGISVNKIKHTPACY